MVAAPGPRRAPRLLGRLRRDRRGVYLLEYALLFNAFTVLLLLCLDAAFQLLVATALDQGAREASRSAALGPIGGILSRDAVLASVLTRTGLPLAAWGSASITAERFADYAALAAAGPLPAGKLCNGSGASTDGTTGVSGGIVRYCIQYEARSFTPFGALIPALYGHRTFFVVQNEPY